MKNNKLKVKPFVISITLVSVIISWLCAFLIAISPFSTLKFFGSIFHGIDISKIASPISVSGVLTSTIAIVIIASITSWIFAVTYNYFSDKVK